METVIYIYERAGRTVNTREHVSEIVFQVDAITDKNIILDFDKIEFISRSFADELFKKCQQFEAKGKNVVIKNANDSVLKMMDAVSHTQNITKREFTPISRYHYTDRKSLTDFLLSI